MITTEEERILSHKAKVEYLRERYACLMKNDKRKQQELIRKVLPDLIEQGFCKPARVIDED